MGLQHRLLTLFRMHLPVNSDFPLEKVRVIVPFVGGGFGGKSAYQQGIEAAKLAKLSGKPVMVIWTRDEEFFYDNFHSAGVVKIKSGIDKAGLIKLWDYHVYYAGTRGSETIYDVPNAKQLIIPEIKMLLLFIRLVPVHGGLRITIQIPLHREVQIDIMASAAAGIDPLEFRLKNLKDEKMIACLKAVADNLDMLPEKHQAEEVSELLWY